MKIVGQWPTASLRVLEVPSGLIVEQAGGWFLAKDWIWTKDVERFVDLCIDAGFYCAIRSSHPKRNNRARGIQYIGMSQSPHDRWTVCIDQYSPKSVVQADRITQFTVEKAYRRVIESARIPHRQERAGGKNIFIPFDQLESALTVCGTAVEDVEAALGARQWEQVKDELGFVTEAVLESAIVDRWNEIGVFEDLQLIGNQIDHMDVLAWHEPTGALAVLELKRGPAGTEVIEQLRGYVEGAARRHNKGQPIFGGLVAREFSKEAQAHAKLLSFPIRLYTFSGTAREMEFRIRYSNWKTD